MNLLLVDDEPVTIKGLMNGVNWENAEIDNVFTAYNSVEARKVICENQIDIVVCDIEMPGENGIAFLKWLHEGYPYIVSIILSGYERFEYAQQAVSLNVMGYLLKPVPCYQFEMEIRACVKKSLELRVRNWLDNSSNNSTGHELTAGTRILISEILKYIDENLSKDINRTEISNAFFMHPDNLSKYFKKMMGLSIPEYISEKRIEKSKQYLVNTDYSISEISSIVGFSNLSYFTAIFKKATGFTPTVYRQKYCHL